MDIHEIEKIELNRDISKIYMQNLVKSYSKKNNIHIVFVMVWTQVCGGSKIILEYANRLAKIGDKITIITYDEKPNWFELDDRIQFIKCTIDKNITDNIPKCDLIVATSWKCIYEAINSNRAPVVFFEQGGAHLFEFSNLTDRKKEIVSKLYKIVPFIHTVSSYSKEIINKEFNRNDVKVICNAVDDNIFYPSNQKNKEDGLIKITIIGSEDFKFKNIDGILKAVRVLKEQYENIKLNWITQTKPIKNKEKAIINPKQKQIGEILRNTDIYVCNSQYESFGLPTLEAMTCGVAIVTTDTGGMRDFVIDKKNGIVINKNDINDMVEKIKNLIENKELRNGISLEACKTAKQFNWDTIIEQVHQYYREISCYKLK